MMTQREIKDSLQDQFVNLFDENNLGTGYFPELPQGMDARSAATKLPAIKTDHSGLATDNKLLQHLKRQ